MTRNLKMLGLALAAMSVLGASAAQAAFAAEEFHSESEETTITASADGTQSFTAAGHTITCEEANFMATQYQQTTPGVTFKPSANGGGGAAGYGGCEFLGVRVKVEMHECDFVFHGNGKIDISGTNCYTKHQVGNGEGEVAAPIEFKISALGGLLTCHVEIGSQTGLIGATYNNLGTGANREITTEVSIEGITYTSEGTGGGCETLPTGTNGKYEGNQIATGQTTTEPHEMVGIWHE